jgi:hypothetical protein
MSLFIREHVGFNRMTGLNCLLIYLCGLVLGGCVFVDAADYQITPFPTIPTLLPPVLTPTATSYPSLVWSENIDSLIEIGSYRGIWSPVANELALHRCRGFIDDMTGIFIAEAPDFQAHLLLSDKITCGTTSARLLWTQDGERIVFTGTPPEGKPGFDPFRVWIVDRNGNNSHPLSKESAPGRWGNLLGWMDDHTLVLTSYAGGGGHVAQIIDIRAEKDIAWAQVSGDFSKITPDYIAAQYIDGGAVGVFAVSRFPNATPPESGMMSMFGEYAIGFPYHQLTIEYGEPDEPHHIWFADWLPGTNKMLVNRLGLTRGVNYATSSQLLLWDVDHKNLSILVSGGWGGRFSPDGRYLAYIAVSQNELTSTSQPDRDANALPPPGNEYSFHILDMQTSATLFSTMFFDSSLRTTDEGFLNSHPASPRFVFSPDNRYLALMLPDESGISVQEGGFAPRPVILEILDLTTGTIIYQTDSRAKRLVWSPTSKYLVYNDQQNNLSVLSLRDLTSQRLTTIGGESIGHVDWSYDGTYLSIEYSPNPGQIPHLVIVQMSSPEIK